MSEIELRFLVGLRVPGDYKNQAHPSTMAHKRFPSPCTLTLSNTKSKKKLSVSNHDVLDGCKDDQGEGEGDSQDGAWFVHRLSKMLHSGRTWRAVLELWDHELKMV
jgi:hypothetical protein